MPGDEPINPIDLNELKGPKEELTINKRLIKLRMINSLIVMAFKTNSQLIDSKADDLIGITCEGNKRAQKPAKCRRQ